MPEEAITLAYAHDLRARAITGEAVTDEEMAKAVQALRQDRMTAKPQQKGKAKASPVSLFDLTGSEEDKG